MKIAVEIDVECSAGNIGECVSRFVKAGCDVRSVICGNPEETTRMYKLESVYDDQIRFDRAVESLKSDLLVNSLTVRNHLEDLLAGGFISVSGRTKMDSPADYEMNLRGASRAARERIMNGDTPVSYTGITRSIGVITGMRRTAELKRQLECYHFSESETSCAVISHFAGMNAFPLIIRYDLPEDFLRMTGSLSAGLSAIRVEHLDADDNSDLIEQLIDESDLPIISKSFDEMPILILSAILRKMKAYKFKQKDCNIGFIGISSGVIRLSRICNRMGFMRVLGYDNNEKAMLHLERQKGLATTPEHIFGNADILVITKQQFADVDLTRMRPGLVVISLIDDVEAIDAINSKRMCRDIVSGDWADPAIVYPGLVTGLIQSGKKALSDSELISIAELIAESEPDSGLFNPSPYSGIIQKIHGMLTGAE